MTEAEQQLPSLVEIPPAVQSASVWHSRVKCPSSVNLGGQDWGVAVQETPLLPLVPIAISRQQAFPPQSSGP